uniref:DUF805 domain-containing protein n=1 Tax=Bosea sp. NBC_00436 TaxID=2969620 RepID=A0A9E8CPK2_9HYPH
MQLSPDGEASILGTIFWIAIFFPSLAVSTRRLHDIGRSGWWQLLWLTMLGGILVVIWQCFPSDPALNKYDVANAAPART